MKQEIKKVRSILICGQAGQGIQTIGYILAKILVGHGYYVFAWQDFQSRIRGGESSFRIVFDSEPVASLPQKYDIIVSLDEKNTKHYRNLLSDDGVLISDTIDDESILFVPFQTIAQDVAGEKIYSNSVAVGSVCKIVGLEYKILEKVFKDYFSEKGDVVLQKNLSVVKKTYETVSSIEKIKRDKIEKKLVSRILITGNESLSLGAIAAGCKFMSAYPMTPSTGIITYLSETSHKTGILTEQVEDEISAINMAIGASYAGVRSLTASSGGGFCLMVEGLSLAAMTETPIVIILGQRPGPATGLPTRTEQGELNFVLNAGHGEFPRFVFAPSDAESAFYTTIKAVELSQKFRVPSIILTDQYLADSYWTVEEFFLDKISLNYYFAKEEDIGEEFYTHKITTTGVSPRLIPGRTKHLVITDSDEHDERGNITEDNEIRKRMVEKRWAKLHFMEQEIVANEIFLSLDTEIVLITWGTNKWVVTKVARLLNQKGIKAGVVSYTDLWPLKISPKLMSFNKKKIVVENNFTGQFANLLESKGLKVDRKILKYNGLPFSEDELLSEIEKNL